MKPEKKLKVEDWVQSKYDGERIIAFVLEEISEQSVQVQVVQPEKFETIVPKDTCYVLPTKLTRNERLELIDYAIDHGEETWFYELTKNQQSGYIGRCL